MAQRHYEAAQRHNATEEDGLLPHPPQLTPPPRVLKHARPAAWTARVGRSTARARPTAWTACTAPLLAPPCMRTPRLPSPLPHGGHASGGALHGGSFRGGPSSLSDLTLAPRVRAHGRRLDARASSGLAGHARPPRARAAGGCARPRRTTWPRRTPWPPSTEARGRAGHTRGTHHGHSAQPRDAQPRWARSASPRARATPPDEGVRGRARCATGGLRVAVGTTALRGRGRGRGHRRGRRRRCLGAVELRVTLGTTAVRGHGCGRAGLAADEGDDAEDGAAAWARSSSTSPWAPQLCAATAVDKRGSPRARPPDEGERGQARVSVPRRGRGRRTRLPLRGCEPARASSASLPPVLLLPRRSRPSASSSGRALG